MRKLYWWGAAGLLACAGAAYMTCDFLAGRAAVPAPVPESPPALIGAISELAGAGVSAATPSAKPKSRIVAQAMLEDCPELPVCPPAPEATEPILVSVPDLAEALRETVVGQADFSSAKGEEGEEQHTTCAKASWGGLGAAAAGATEECEEQVVPPSDVSTADPVPDLPRCEDGPKQSTSGKVPYVEDSSESAADVSFLSAWFYFLKKETAHKNKGEDNAGQEQSEFLPIDPAAFPPGAEGVPPGREILPPPNCQENPNHDREYPACPCLNSDPKAHCPATSPEPKDKQHQQTKIYKEQLWKVLKMNAEAPEEKGQCHRGLDTMECRPSDMRGMNVDPNAPF